MSVASFQSSQSLAFSIANSEINGPSNINAKQIIALVPHCKAKVQIQVFSKSHLGKGTFATVEMVELLIKPNEYSKSQEPILEQAALKITPLKFKKELQILQKISGYHPNIIQLKYYFIGCVSDEYILYLVFELMPENLFNLIKRYEQNQKTIPVLTRKLLMRQVLSALEFIHNCHIVHRDIKCLNILIDIECYMLKLADFGSSTFLTVGERKSLGAGSRFYQAPELLCGNSYYNFTIDIWASAIVFIEMIIMKPIFQGKNNVGQLISIFEVLGYPSEKEKEILSCKLSLDDSKITECKLHQILKLDENDVIIDLLKKMLDYNFHKRLQAAEAMKHAYFDE